jgi:hypothetical protein
MFNIVFKHAVALIYHLFHIIYFNLQCNLLLVTPLPHMFRAYTAIIKCLLSRENCCPVYYVKISYRVGTRYFLIKTN